MRKRQFIMYATMYIIAIHMIDGLPKTCQFFLFRKSQLMFLFLLRNFIRYICDNLSRIAGLLTNT